jgi:hypothetical protein
MMLTTQMKMMMVKCKWVENVVVEELINITT